jgi:peptidoglycan/xylan/chitin deacetylase (PgdA/CDA1 family)
VFVIGKLISATGAAAGYLAYHAYSPSSQLFGAALSRCPDPRDLALTYDDGPNDVHTEQLLDILARHEMKATFFLIGRFVKARPHIARSIVDAGHLVANHTVNHPNLLFLPHGAIARELSDCSQMIADATGVIPKFFRPPFGTRRPAVLSTARELGLEPIMWDVTCFDWRRITTDAIERHARKRIDRVRTHGHIILLHDGGHTGLGADRSRSVEATERIIRRYKATHRFCRVDEIQPRASEARSALSSA